MEVITLNDLLSSIDVLRKKEADDSALLFALGKTPTEELQTKLMKWAMLGFPPSYQLLQFKIEVPPKCSDGSFRTLDEYIVFCSGRQLREHVNDLQQRLVDIEVSFANYVTHLAVIVTRTS